MSNDFVKGFTFLRDNPGLIADNLGKHLEISGVAVLIALVIGLPLGVWLGHIHRFSFLAINISNLGRALPSLGILAILLPYVGVGNTDVIIALVVLAFPPILTNAYVAIDQVDADTVDAAKGIGLRPRQVLFTIEIPQALPVIFAGIRTSSVFVVATATLAGIFGGGGLGVIINNRESYGLDGIIGVSYVLIALAFAVQALFIALERSVTPAGISGARKSGRSRLLRRRATVLPETDAPAVAVSGPGGEQGSST